MYEHHDLGKQKRTMSVAEETEITDVTADSVDALLAASLIEHLEPSIDCVSTSDMEEAASALSESDRKALAAMESADDFIARMRAEFPPPQPAELQLEFDTTWRAASETKAQKAHSMALQDKELIRLAGKIREFAGREQVAFDHIIYRMKDQLGEGGQGIVFLLEAEDQFGARRAMKLFRPSSSDMNAATFLHEMERMGDVASRVHRSWHDDLVNVDWFGIHDGVHVMLMQFIDGFNLQELLQPKLLEGVRPYVDDERWNTLNNVVYSNSGSQQLAFRPSIAVYIAERILRGLERLHGEGLVHSDIKPSNVMLDASGSLKIIDIGSAFRKEAPPKIPLGTPAYAATELLESKQCTEQSDLASVGYVLVEMLSGQPIAQGICGPDATTRTIGKKERDAHLALKRDLPDKLGELIPAKVRDAKLLVELCQRLIAPKPGDRFKDANAVIDVCFKFNKDLIIGDLAINNYKEIQHLLRNAKKADRRRAS
ncbi:MAG TPA: serine/threonine-protein kinase [Pirellulales bacterium]|nr:serine/threonine-protein kinase [Pirellulales bacterium]